MFFMGITFEIGSLEEMCALMCDNVIPGEEKKNTMRIFRNKFYEVEEIIFGAGDCYLGDMCGDEVREIIGRSKYDEILGLFVDSKSGRMYSVKEI